MWAISARFADWSHGLRRRPQGKWNSLPARSELTFDRFDPAEDVDTELARAAAFRDTKVFCVEYARETNSVRE
jgi:hypothetical protein